MGISKKRAFSKIIEKPLFFLGFFNISRKFLEAFGNVLWGPLGTPWEALLGGPSWEYPSGRPAMEENAVRSEGSLGETLN